MPPGILLFVLLQVDECVSTAAAETPAEMGSIKPWHFITEYSVKDL